MVIPVGAVGAANWLIDLLPTDSGLVQVVANVALLIISFLLLTVIIGFTFQTLTNIVIPWKAARRGGLATAVVGLVAAYGVGQYLARAAGSGTLGALGGIAVLLFFFNLMWNVYLFGGEVTKVYGDRLKAAEAQAEREVAEEQAALSVAGPAPKISRSGKISREALSGKVEAGAGAFLVGLALGWFGRRR